VGGGGGGGGDAVCVCVGVCGVAASAVAKLTPYSVVSVSCFKLAYFQFEFTTYKDCKDTISCKDTQFHAVQACGVPWYRFLKEGGQSS
jgi:hypothetical protein